MILHLILADLYIIKNFKIINMYNIIKIFKNYLFKIIFN